MSNFRYDGTVRNVPGFAVAGASIAVLTQPADVSTQPGSPLASIFSASTSNSASITGASYVGGFIVFQFSTTPPADVVDGAFFTVSGITPSGYNGTWQVSTINGNNVSVVTPYAATAPNPGTYVSGGTVATSTLPNPLQSDGNGQYFFYATPTTYTVQVYSGALPIIPQVYVDQVIVSPGAGTVTSVALTAPAEFTVTGSPVTASGTLAISKNNQNANLVYAGPGTGGAAAPTFRALVAADIAGLGAGSVTSVGLAVSVPNIFNSAVITNSPVTTTGTLTATVTLANQAANTVFAGPSSGGSSTPSFRPLVIADYPAAGSTTQVQVNSGGLFYADSGFTYNHTIGAVGIGVDGSINGNVNIFPFVDTGMVDLYGAQIVGVADGTSNGDWQGVTVSSTNSSSGAWTTWYNYNSAMGGAETGSIAHSAHYYAGVAAFDGGGAITEHDGLYIEDQKAGNDDSISTYAIHIASQTSPGFAVVTEGAAPSKYGGSATWQNQVAATSLANQNSPVLSLGGTFWDGAASQNAVYALQVTVGTGSNPTTSLMLTGGDFQTAGNANVGSNVTAGAIFSGGNVTLYGNTPASGISNVVFGHLVIAGNYWDGAASQVDSWTETLALGTGTNPTSTFTIAHTGTPGLATLVLPELVSIGAGGVVKSSIKLNISSAQLLALPGTPLTLIAAPGSNKMVIIQSMTSQFRHVTTPYTIANPDNTLNLVYHGHTDAIGGYTTATGLVDQAVNTIYSMSDGQFNAAIPQSQVVNLAVDLTLQGTTPALTLGDGTLELILEYSIVDVS